MVIKKKGRPARYAVVKEDKLAELRYKLAQKDSLIKQLEMEKELMWDFRSFTGSEDKCKIYGDLSSQGYIFNC